MATRTRKRYTDEQKSSILAAAQKDGLTAADVQKKFGVKPITYYSWRKKSGTAARRGRPAGARRGPGRPPGPGRAAAEAIIGLDQVRGEVQSRIRAMIPDVVRAEVDSFMNTLLGSSVGRSMGMPARRRRRTRKKK